MVIYDYNITIVRLFFFFSGKIKREIIFLGIQRNKISRSKMFDVATSTFRHFCIYLYYNRARARDRFVRSRHWGFAAEINMIVVSKVNY